MRSTTAVSEVRVGVSGDVEQPRVVEFGFVAVGRVVPHRHLVAGFHTDAAEFDVFGQIAPHEDHRAGPPDDLFDRSGCDAVEVGPPCRPGVGVSTQCHHAVADGVAGCLVAGSGQQHEERGDLRGRQLLTVDLGRHQVRGQVIGGFGAAGLSQLDAVRGEVEDHLNHLVVVGGHFLVADSQCDRRPVEDLLLVGFRDAHHVADDLQRERPGKGLDEVCRPVGVSGHHVAHQLPSPLSHALVDAGHHFGCERPIDYRSKALVTRVIEVDHRAAEFGDCRVDFAQRHAGRGGAEQVRVPARMVDMVVGRQRPVAGARLESGRRG